MRKNSLTLAFAVIITALLLSACGTPNQQETNPFQIGQVIYPNADYATEHTDEEVTIAKQGAKVLDITSEFVRVQYSDGNVDVLSFLWFEPAEMELTDEWAIGNPFHEGDEVCAVPDSVREDFPDEGTVTGITMDYILIDDYGSLLNWSHFQSCE
jgi:hypothetical protein